MGHLKTPSTQMGYPNGVPNSGTCLDGYQN